MHLCTQSGDSALNNSVAMMIFIMALKHRKGNLSEYFLNFKTQIQFVSVNSRSVYPCVESHICFSLYIHKLLMLCQCINSSSDNDEKSLLTIRQLLFQIESSCQV